MAYRKRVTGKSRGPEFPTTLQEGQRTLCLPPSAKLRCVPPDGDCFFHSVKTKLVVDMSIAELREITKCPKGWADEAVMLAVATHEAVQTQFMCYPVDLENLARGVDPTVVVPIGPPARHTLHLVSWCRNMAGLRFDVLEQGSKQEENAEEGEVEVVFIVDKTGNDCDVGTKKSSPEQDATTPSMVQDRTQVESSVCPSDSTGQQGRLDIVVAERMNSKARLDSLPYLADTLPCP